MTSMTKYTVALIKESKRQYNIGSPAIGGPSDMYEISKRALHMDALAEEQFWIICLDTKNQVIGLHLVSQGNLNSSVVHPREVFKRALANNAASIIALHNHPSGNPAPSQNDLDITKRLVEAGELLGVPVLDHLIIGDGNYVSLKEKCLI